LLAAGMLIQAVGLALFSTISVDGTYLGDVLVPSLLVAAGIGMSFVPVTIAAVSGVAPSEAGLASGLVNTSRLMGGALGLAVLVTLATSRTTGELPHHAVGPHVLHAAMTDGYHLGFTVGAG